MCQAHNEKITEFHYFLFHLQLSGGVKLETYSYKTTSERKTKSCTQIQNNKSRTRN